MPNEATNRPPNDGRLINLRAPGAPDHVPLTPAATARAREGGDSNDAAVEAEAKGRALEEAQRRAGGGTMNWLGRCAGECEQSVGRGISD
ncbi:Protein of unknown function [Gryllus bimaculatus]|nr:Protein of unknown function [Gryllus bimaculatus]